MSTICWIARCERAADRGGVMLLQRGGSRRGLPDTIELDGRCLPLVVRRLPAARRLSLAADPAKACIRLTLPRRGSLAEATQFLEANRDWLARRVADWPTGQPFLPGAAIPYRGQRMIIAWDRGHPRTPVVDGDNLRLGGPPEALPRRVESWLKAAAASLLAEDCAGFAAAIDRPAPMVRVGDPKTRWGSCSATGNIALSWRLVLAPDFVRRAVAAHEVAHLVHLDHSAAFHALAARLSGGTARRATRWLAEHGSGLHWVGRS